MNTAPDTDFGRGVITLLTDALSALLAGVNKLSEVNATWVDLNSFEYLIEDAKDQALAAVKSGEAYCAIPILKPGDHFTLRTDEQDLNEEGQERLTPAGSVWIVQELEPECDPLMQYAVHCPQTGGSIHISHAELEECGYIAYLENEEKENKSIAFISYQIAPVRVFTDLVEFCPSLAEAMSYKEGKLQYALYGRNPDGMVSWIADFDSCNDATKLLSKILGRKVAGHDDSTEYSLRPDTILSPDPFSERVTDWCGQVCGGGNCGTGQICLNGIDPGTHMPPSEQAWTFPEIVSEARILVLRVPACFDAETGTVFDAIDQGADVLGCYPISAFNPGHPLTSPETSDALVCM